MDAASIPETIRTIIDQAGGLGLRGAFTYIGARQFRYRCAQAEGEYRSGFRSRLTSEGGPPRVEFDVGLMARVNGKPGRAWTLIIVYEPDDTYTLVRREERTQMTVQYGPTIKRTCGSVRSSLPTPASLATARSEAAGTTYRDPQGPARFVRAVQRLPAQGGRRVRLDDMPNTCESPHASLRREQAKCADWLEPKGNVVGCRLNRWRHTDTMTTGAKAGAKSFLSFE